MFKVLPNLLPVALLTLLTLLACSAPARAQPPGVPAAWSLRVPQEPGVSYRGLASFDKAGKGATNTTYMMPGVVGTALAVAAHGLLINNGLQQQKSEIELRADQVLEPYLPVLDALRHEELMTQALAQMAPGSKGKLISHLDMDESGWIVESTPVFFMTQDQGALILDNVIAVYAPGALKQASYRNTVRVVSRLVEHADLPTYWNDTHGAPLRRHSAALLALSYEIALAQAQADPAAAVPASAFRTVRYQQGGKQVAERAQLLGEHCGRVLLRNLRGWLMSVPLDKSAVPDGCVAES